MEFSPGEHGKMDRPTIEGDWRLRVEGFQEAEGQSQHTPVWYMSREETQDKNNGKNIFLNTLYGLVSFIFQENETVYP